ncbi:hypothetical protein GmHk_01G002493 [Glycine max]|nr:hypothetical protein GmHk_01G002493 [Glycine max]
MLLLPSSSPSRMSRSRALSSRWTSLNEELEHILANVPKLTIKEHGEWRELTNMMQNVTAPPEAFSQIVHAKDQIFGEVGKVYAVKWNDVVDGDVPSGIQRLNAFALKGRCRMSAREDTENWRQMEIVLRDIVIDR